MKISIQELSALLPLEESLWKAETRFDREHMNQILAPDFFEFGRSGRIYTREEALNAPPQKINAELPLKNFQAHTISDDVALVTYISEVTYDELEIANRSSLWCKTGTEWKLVFHQGTAVKG
ncbi:MAG: nuclear transport factor 2 family protein [Patescibacteria group bacterium]